MQINETLVITFLVIVILILIFSKITIGSGDNESTVIENKLKQMEDKLVAAKNVNSTKFDPKGSELLSPEFKKQLDEIESKFYYNNCGGKKI
jgi:hypothetical protein